MVDKNLLVKPYLFFQSYNWFGNLISSGYAEIEDAIVSPLILQEECEPLSIDLDLEIICMTEEYCGTEYWDGTSAEIYLNSINGSTTDSIFVTMVITGRNGLSNLELINCPQPQISETCTQYADTIFNGMIGASELTPLIEYMPNDNYGGGSQLIIIASNGNETATYSLVLSTSEFGDINSHIPCGNTTFVTTNYVHSYIPDTLEYCPPNEICVASYPDVDESEYHFFVFEGEAPDTISNYVHPYTYGFTYIPRDELPFLDDIYNWALSGSEIKKAYLYSYDSFGYVEVGSEIAFYDYTLVEDFEPFFVKLSEDLHYEILPSIDLCEEDFPYDLPDGTTVETYMDFDEDFVTITKVNINNYTQQIENNAGSCDSLFITPITVNELIECHINSDVLTSDTLFLDESSLELFAPELSPLIHYYGAFYTWLPSGETGSSITVNQAGVYTLIISANGYEDYIIEFVVIADCESLANTTNLPPISQCGSIEINNTIYEEAGEYQDIQTFTNQFGCDSIVTQIIEILPTDKIFLPTLYDCDKITHNGITYNQIGYYYATENFTNQAGCDSLVIQPIAIGQSLYCYKGYTAGGGGKNDALQNGISENLALNIYPNPASHFINIRFSETEASKIKNISVYNTAGQLIEKFEYFTPQINVQNWQTGVYVLHITNTTGKTHLLKVLKH